MKSIIYSLIFILFISSKIIAQTQSTSSDGIFIHGFSFREIGYFYPQKDNEINEIELFNETDLFIGYGVELGYNTGLQSYSLLLNTGVNEEEIQDKDLFEGQRFYDSYWGTLFLIKRKLIGTSGKNKFTFQLAGSFGVGFERFKVYEGTGGFYNDFTREFEYPNKSIHETSFFVESGVITSLSYKMKPRTTIGINVSIVEFNLGSIGYGVTSPKFGLFLQI